MRLPFFLLPLLCGLAGPAWAQAQPPASDDLLVRLTRDEAIAYENGEGVPKDPVRAAQLYCQAARQGDAESQYNLAWMYANGRGIERNDATASFFFHAAAEQGLPQAVRMLDRVGQPGPDLPDCMRPPAPVVAAAVAQVPTPQPATELRSNGPKYIVDLVKTIAPEYRVAPSP